MGRRPNNTRSNGIRTLTEAQQALSTWEPPTGPLGELTRASRLRADALVAQRDALERAAMAAPAMPGFGFALRQATVRVIAEIKRRSPSKGSINEGIDAPDRARVYEQAGAAALSVLTEPERFGGSLDDLSAVRAAVVLPLLRKDFIVDEVQLFEARARGASAALLIARGLAPERFLALARTARAIGLEVLLEVRTDAELDLALGVGDAVIGVNNRNLETLVIDDRVSERLLPRVPTDRIAVYESGVSDRAGVERAAALGADAVLVGSSLSSAADPAAALRALCGVARHARG